MCWAGVWKREQGHRQQLQSLMPVSDFISAFLVTFCASACKYYRVGFFCEPNVCISPENFIGCKIANAAATTTVVVVVVAAAYRQCQCGNHFVACTM